MRAPSCEGERGVQRAAAAHLQGKVGGLETERERARAGPGAPQDRQEAVPGDGSLLAIVEEQRQVDAAARRGRRAPQLDHHRQARPSCRRRRGRRRARPRAGRESRLLVAEPCPGGRRGGPRASGPVTGRRPPRSPHPLAGGLLRHVAGERRFLADGAADIAQPQRALRELHQADTPKSRKRRVQGRLAVGALLAHADDQRAGRQVLAGGELPAAACRGSPRCAPGTTPLISRSLRPGHVVEWGGGREHDAGAQDRLLLDQHAFDDDAAASRRRPRPRR